MGQKDKKQAFSHKLERELKRKGPFHAGDVRGYARMRKAILEREKRLAAPVSDDNKAGRDTNSKADQERH